MEIVENILTNNPCFKSGRKITVKGLMLHSVGCPQPSAEVFMRKWNCPEATRACVHAFIDVAIKLKITEHEIYTLKAV